MLKILVNDIKRFTAPVLQKTSHKIIATLIVLFVLTRVASHLWFMVLVAVWVAFAFHRAKVAEEKAKQGPKAPQ